MEDAEHAGNKDPAQVAQAYVLAAYSAHNRIQFKTAMGYLRAAEKLTVVV